MTVISLIAAIDENNGLGKDNQLLCHLPADLKYFKATTLGKPIIMGRKTFESIGKPLPGRKNIVMSRQPFKVEGVEWAKNLEDALTKAGNVPEIMIIGGANIFSQALPLANRLYLTKIHHQFNSDAHFPSVDMQKWQCISSQHHAEDSENKYALTFFCYEKQKTV